MVYFSIVLAQLVQSWSLLSILPKRGSKIIADVFENGSTETPEKTAE